MTTDLKSLALRFGVTPEQLRQQYRANARQLRLLEAKAIESGRKVRGYTADELRTKAERIERLCITGSEGKAA